MEQNVGNCGGEKTREFRYFHNEGLHNSYYVVNIIVAVK